jgi:hypothetical protein
MKIDDCVKVNIVFNSIAMKDNRDINLSLSLPGRHAGGVEVYFHTFLTLALDLSEWSTSCTGHSTPTEVAHRTHRQGRWGGPQSHSGHFVDDKNPMALLDFLGLIQKFISEGF